MGRVRGKDSKPELLVRRMVHALGYRYRLHRRDLPGLPRHASCGPTRVPRERLERPMVAILGSSTCNAPTVDNFGGALPGC